MLSDYRVHPSLATADAARARAWYLEKLGLEPYRVFDGLLVYSIPPTIFTVYETPSAGTAKNTVAVWGVDDLRAEVTRLRARGLVFEDLDFGPDDRTVDGIMTTADERGPVLNAWFKDGDGNWISLGQQPPEPGLEPGMFAMLAASDVARARAWYSEKLGLEPFRVFGDDELSYRSGMTHLSIYKTPSAGTAMNTAAVWRVKDVRAEAADLRARGVVFEDYDFGDERTVDGVLEDGEGNVVAWFKDSEGNVLGLVQIRDEDGF
jgi:catechol 2,3-dioxygenase-like lactoylglutathione lyase family enzyme